MAKPKVINPFYILLMIVGVIFAFTALGYGVMSVKMLQPEKVADRDFAFIDFFDEHGSTLFLVELAVLAVLTALAIGTDGYWTRRSEQKAARENAAKQSEPSEPS